MIKIPSQPHTCGSKIWRRIQWWQHWWHFRRASCLRAITQVSSSGRLIRFQYDNHSGKWLFITLGRVRDDPKIKSKYSLFESFRIHMIFLLWLSSSFQSFNDYMYSRRVPLSRSINSILTLAQTLPFANWCFRLKNVCTLLYLSIILVFASDTYTW
jgi:hypothetical protein